MRRRNLIVHSDSDEEDGAGMATTTTPASVSASVASGGGSGSVVRLSPPNPSPVPVPFPPLSQSSAPFVISDDDEEADDIVDPDGDSPIVDAPEAFSPPPPPSSTPAPAPARPPPPPPPITTPFRTPIQTPPARTPIQTPPTRTPTPIPTQPPSRTPASTTPPHPSALNGWLRPVDDFLRRLGLLLRPDWLESCAAGIPGFDGLRSAEAQARRCFEQFLFADMDACGAGVLPEGVGGMHAVSLDGPFVLQVDEIVNISAPLKDRYREVSAGPKRCLKLSMTDGVQRIFGMEYRPIKDLAVLAPAGLKIIIRNVHIRRGLLMLVPEAVEILGGVVDELEAAHDRLVSEVNKPPRGRRKQGGLPLSSRATLAAWPRNNNVTNGGNNVTNGGEPGISVQGAVNSSYPTVSGNTFQVGRATEIVVEEPVRPPAVEEIQRLQEANMPGLSASLMRETTETSTHTTHNCEPTHIIERSTKAIMEECVDPPIIANNVDEQMQRVQDISMQEQATAFGSSERMSSVSTPCGYDSQRFSHAIDGTAANGVEVARSPKIDEIKHMEQSFILSGENEQPFTYIYSMLADWGRQDDTKAYIQGKIQGVITSVKNFQYKQRTEYELHVYIDDGSFISEAFIDNNIVKNMLGLSPGEVTAALAGELEFASPSEVKGSLKGFQRFLVKFEGVMLIELNKNSSIPIIRELNEGCSSSISWLLLRRLKTFSSQKRVQSLDIMDTTP